MVAGDLHIQKVLAKFHGLQRGQIEGSEIIEIFHAAIVAHLQIAAVRIQQFAFDDIHGDRILAVAVGDVIVIVLHGDIAKLKLLLAFDCGIVNTEKVFQQSLQRSFVGEGRLDGILQISQAGFASPRVGVVKITAIIQRTTFEHNFIIFFTKNRR